MSEPQPVYKLSRIWEEKNTHFKIDNTNPDYLEKVREYHKPRPVGMDEAKKLFSQDANAYTQRTKKAAYTWNDENKKALAQMYPLMVDAENNVGIGLIGNYGSGKSALMEIFKTHLLRFRPIRIMNIINTHELVSDYNLKGEESLLRFREGIWCFDDLGTENIAMYFGNREELMTRVIEMRYLYFQKRGTPTHFTSNATPAELRERYSRRVAERLAEMTKTVFLGAAEHSTNFRLPAPPKTPHQ